MLKTMRIGIGYDIHRLAEKRKLFLGGVDIPFSKGLLGHSDGDAVMHALCDALLGACGLADIGEYFPDTDARYKSIASTELLKKVHRLVQKNGYSLLNIDLVIIAQEPKLLRFKEKIRNKIAETLGMEKTAVGVKAKTNEGLGPIGEKKAIASYAVVLLRKNRRRL